ncbi:copper amine oxidase N-terminal domain-containing protein [Anaerotignum lactatifermentans]|uniref:copper amine oxidase N-terminal domain-containing protein n=1 Tax=Anaerotignum lactatifermentans TaxID=160404 RepID=UPI00248E78EE|nr:stalk domain-containing protein [Anaerotignum lactatifermentans]
MKKFLSMVMAAAMVVSLVPATAFAASDDVKATAKVVDSKNYTQDEIEKDNVISGPELQLTFTTADYTTAESSAEIEVTLDNADFSDDASLAGFAIKADGDTYKWQYPAGTFGETPLEGVDGKKLSLSVKEVNSDKDEVTLVLNGQMDRGWVLTMDLTSVMDKTSKGKTATVSVDSDDIKITNGDDLTYASVEAAGIKASVKDTVDIATEEVATIKDIKVEPAVGDTFAAAFGNDAKSYEFKLKLNSGFEFTNSTSNPITFKEAGISPVVEYDDDEIIIKVGTGIKASDVMTIKDLDVEATSAKAGSTATIKVYATGCDTVSVEVAKVVDYTVVMSVDEDEDVPVIYSGVNVDNKGITDDSDHETLEVTIKESFAGAWNNSKDFTLSVPEGVYIVDVVDEAFDNDANSSSFDTQAWFEAAYEEGDYVDLTFKRRGWEETNPDDHDPAELTFKLVVVADPNFEGDVVLKLTGDAVDEQEVTVAKFVKPYTVEAQQNDMQIDYRNTEIPTSVVIKEAEAGLWDKETTFELTLDKIEFDDEGKIAVDDKSGLEVKDDEIKVDKDGVLSFEVSSRSDDEPAVVTISGLQLYMERSLPAGAYDLDMVSPEMNTPYVNTVVLNGANDKVDGDPRAIHDINDDFVSYTAKAGFVNIITAGREDTDSFTTKVVVPVGESYLISGENKVEIPVPAYINAAGYTMLPLRAVAVALGINENNVLWDQSTRTATVMYGSKIINMTYGQKVVYVNGAMIPATAAVEITNDRMFLGLRDLGNALGVTDITWDAATKTATLNGNK